MCLHRIRRGLTSRGEEKESSPDPREQFAFGRSGGSTLNWIIAHPRLPTSSRSFVRSTRWQFDCLSTMRASARLAATDLSLRWRKSIITIIDEQPHACEPHSNVKDFGGWLASRRGEQAMEGKRERGGGERARRAMRKGRKNSH